MFFLSCSWNSSNLYPLCNSKLIPYFYVCDISTPFLVLISALVSYCYYKTITTNLVALGNTNILFHTSRYQNSKMGLTGLKQRYQYNCIYSAGSRTEYIPFPLKILQARFSGLWPSFIFKTRNCIILTSYSIIMPVSLTLLLPFSLINFHNQPI